MDGNDCPRYVLGIQLECAVVFYHDANRRQEIERRIGEKMLALYRSREVFDILGLTDATFEAFVFIGSQENVVLSCCISEVGSRYPSSGDAEIGWIEQETRAFLKKVARLISEYVSKTHRMPPMAEIERIVGESVSFEKERPSELLVNRDLRIILPSYGNLEFPLQPLPKALYLLFLLHPEGIRLAELADYRTELTNLYGLIIPNRDELLAKKSIAMLTDPMDTNSLRQQISRIKRIVTVKIQNPAIAGQYYISGERGQEYRIPLSRHLIRLPKVLMA